jgi:N-hydroxyarylamine O-acetyltransferase
VADGGLGEGLLEPIPLREGRFESGPFHVELARDGDGWWVGFHEHAGLPGFRFADTAVPLSAFARHHKRLATSPASGFVRVLVVQAPRADRILTLRARTYSEAGPGVQHREVLPDEAAFTAVLQERFGIDPVALGRERVARLWARACAQHEAFAAG